MAEDREKIRETEKKFFSSGKKIFMISVSLLVLLLLSLFFLLLSSREDPAVRGKRSRRYRSKQFYPKLENYSVALIIMTAKRTFLPGSTQAKVVFALKNTGHTKLTVKEWRMSERANLRIRYAPGKPEEALKIPWSKWKDSPTFDKTDPYAEIRTPLILHPINNNALIEVPLSFLKDVKNRGRRQYFTIIAELNLTSISAKSEPVLITVK